MWKILNKLFGWDYIAWRNSADNGVARVHVGYGVVWFYRYRITKLVDKIKDKDQVTWLTCDFKKYLDPDKYVAPDKLVGVRAAMVVLLLYSVYYAIYTF
jgi:hypothetical protein